MNSLHYCCMFSNLLRSFHHRLEETRATKVKKGKTKRENRAGERETIEAKGDE